MKNNLLKKMFFVAFMLTGSVIFAQTVSGTVSDSSGPLPGANVVVKGTTNGVTTDFDGKYTLNNVPSDAVLVFSFIGYAAQEVAVAGQSTVDVTLEEDSSELDEVVVTGYSSQTRGDITGSVASVDMEEAVKTPTVNAAEALQGRVTGVTVVTNGKPGDAPKINIRGFGTSNNTNPLYIIDGVQTDDPNALNSINPNDIEQMNVLKDGAAAIYGARASNGVVIVTTKGGGYNMASAKISVDMYAGFSEAAGSYDMLGAQDHAQVLLQSKINSGDTDLSHGQYDPTGSGIWTVPATINGYTRVISYDPIVFAPDGTFTASVRPNGTDWYDAITQTAPTQNISVSVENGNENGKYFMSASYLNREGVLIHTGYERVGTKLNSEFKIGEKFKIGEHINITYSNSKDGNGEAIENSFRMTPVLPVRDDHGEFAGVRGPGLGNTRNPVAQLYRASDDYNRLFSVIADVYASYEIIEGLTAKTVLAGTYGGRDVRNFTALDPEHGEPLSTNALFMQDETSTGWTWTNTLNYVRTFGEDHSVNALVGVEALRNDWQGKRISNTGYLFEDPDFYLLSNGSGAPNVEWHGRNWNSLWSLFGTVNYAYKGKYSLTATLRQDTSSRFKGDNQSDIFPSFSAGWDVSKEDFYPEDAFVNRVKLRASWGQLGNQTLPTANPTVNISGLDITQADYYFDGSGKTTGAVLQAVGNPDLKWETSVSTNIGVDLSMLESRLNVGLEFYQIKTKDLIVQDQSLISSTAIDAAAPYVNSGDIKNTGFDLTLGYGDQTDSGFSYNVSANLSHYKNEVEEWINPFQDGRGDLRNGSVTRTQPGEEMSYFFGRKVTGLDDTGRMVFADVNGDGTVDDSDRTKIGSPHPDFTYGINANLAYKGFDMSLFFTGSQGNDIYNYNKYFTEFGLFFNGNRSTNVLNAWTPDNTNTSVPALLNGYPIEEVSSNSYFVEDGSYFRLKNLQIGYSLPEDVTDKIGMSNLRLYLQGTNIFTITSYSGLDPEVVAYDNLSLGIDSRLYPVSRIFSIGANIKF